MVEPLECCARSIGFAVGVTDRDDLRSLRVLGFKKAGALVYIAGSFDMTGLDVLMIEGDQLNPDREDSPRVDFNSSEPNKDLIDWYEQIVEDAYREAKG